MRPPLTFFVEGTPKGQPRCRSRGNGKGVYDPGTAETWKAAVAEVWRNVVSPESAVMVPFDTAVRLSLTFWFRRPKGHFGSGKNAAVLRKGVPVHHTGKPDCDNLAKAVMDILTRLRAWDDDVLVSTLIVRRRWSDDRPGCVVNITEADSI